MRKIKNSALLVLSLTAACSLTACFGKKTDNKDGVDDATKVVFWSSFGGAYTGVLDGICSSISQAKGIEIEHKSQHSYDNILSEMTSAIALEDYPYIAQGYPDHFATYLSAGILNPIDEFLTDEIRNDYFDAYMHENKFYDASGKAEHTYALPFNKSTEVLGYNGVFVDYCASIDPTLATLPETWDEWAGAKGQAYNTIFFDLIEHSSKIYGIQDENGHLTSVHKDTPVAGEKLLLSFSVDNKDTSRLMSWDATDNAFITLTRQWDAEYTSLPDSENTKPIVRRAGHIRFTESSNKAKVVNMLKFFNNLSKKQMFGVPAELGNNYSSEAFANNKVMFMVCSSGGLSYNNTEGAWNRRFRIAPIPYKDGSHKYVISQGANICMTDKGDPAKNFEIMRALTSGDFQAEWCLQTGYYPCSKSATNNPKYQAFLAEEKYPESATGAVSATRVAYREGSQVNSNYYMNEALNWVKFVDPAFVGSSEIRTAVKPIFRNVFSDIDLANIDNTSLYEQKITGVINSTIRDSVTIVVD